MSHSITPLPKVDLVLVTALVAEARPLLDKWRFQHVISEYGFRLYYSEHRCSALLITGIGRNSAAAGVMWASSYILHTVTSWYCNLGIAGHAVQELGTLLWVNKVAEQHSEAVHYPPLLRKNDLPGTELVTVDKPCDEYPENCAVDMEASAFVETARRLVSSERVQLLKIVSDNPQSHYTELNKDKVQELIAQQLPAIEKFVSQIQNVLTTTQTSFADLPIEKMRERWHITVSQSRQLERLWESRDVLQQYAADEAPDWQQYSSVKEYLTALEHWLMAVTPTLDKTRQNG